jgi:hypothetical protein
VKPSPHSSPPKRAVLWHADTPYCSGCARMWWVCGTTCCRGNGTCLCVVNAYMTGSTARQKRTPPRNARALTHRLPFLDQSLAQNMQQPPLCTPSLPQAFWKNFAIVVALLALTWPTLVRLRSPAALPTTLSSLQEEDLNNVAIT